MNIAGKTYVDTEILKRDIQAMIDERESRPWDADKDFKIRAWKEVLAMIDTEPYYQGH